MRAATQLIPSRSFNEACVYEVPGTDQREDASLLNALTNVAKEANEDLNLPGIE